VPRPSIKVYQKLVTVTPSIVTPFFELCVVGPVYQVVRDQLFKNALAGSVQDYAAVAFESPYVGKATGAVVDTNFVSCTLKETMVKVWPKYVADTDVLNATVSVDNTDKVTKLTYTDTEPSTAFLLAGVQEGDIAYVTVGTNVYTASIQEVTDTLNIKLGRNIPTPVAETDKIFDATLTIIRPAANIALPVGATGVTVAADKISLPAILTTVIGGSTFRVFSAKAYTTYRALKTYMSGDFTQIRDSNDVEANIGLADVANPMSIAADIVASNASISYKILGIETDDKEGYLKALDMLTTRESVYVIVPLTNDREVVTAYANHCTAMSMPEKSKFRIAYCNLPMPLTRVIVERNDGLMTRLEAETVVTIWDDANGLFVTNGALVNDYVDIYNATTSAYMYSLKMVEVFNDSVATCGIDIYDLTDEGYVKRTGGTQQVAEGTDTAVKYEVTRKLASAGIADALIAIAKSYSNKRLRLVMPDLVQISVKDVDYDLPGYFLCVAYGAMRAGFPPHQGFSTLGVGGIKRIYRANRFFKDDDLDRMVDGGVFWTVQDEPESLPYCAYQTTTDTTQLEVKEDSCVATVDFASRFFKDNLKAVLGKFNVNEISAKYVGTVIKDIGERMQRMSYPYIGPILLGFQYKGIEMTADKLKPKVAIDIPFPVNSVELDLEV
jgi:hypothetical protein